MRQIKSALISVFHKDGLLPIIKTLDQFGVKLYSTGGTERFIKESGIPVTSVESLTGYPSIFGGRVKTLHPKIFGGILARRKYEPDRDQIKEFEIPEFDLVIVDLYPFEETVRTTNVEQEIIEKIDIGGISLIRAAAKNFEDVLIISNRCQYERLLNLLEEKNGYSSLDDRRWFAAEAFNESSDYDTAIFNYFSKTSGIDAFKLSVKGKTELRYGENPHQKGVFYLDAAIALISEFDEPTLAILKHNNACGVASRENLTEAWKAALAGDPVSAFGGVLIANREIDTETANEMNNIFFEIILAPGYEDNALEILKSKKNRIILQAKQFDFQHQQFRTALNGILFQDKDQKKEKADDLNVVTKRKPSERELNDLLWANRIVKHTKSNAIVLVKNKQLIGSGTGQTSRVDAVKHSIDKAINFELDLKGAVMASDAFFPFADSVEFAAKAGITAIIQPGGSVKDQDSIDYCNNNDLTMVFTGVRHFKH